jgi:PPM family protein phosphatase
MTSQTAGPVRLHGLLFDVAGMSGQGPRAENQDAFAVDTFPSLGIVAVADGMGGERAGRMAADTALQAVAAGGPIRSVDAARYAVRAADEAVARAAGESPADREGMGCALALLGLVADRAGEVGFVAANVGDVRVLSRSPDGMVRLETRDHTPAFALFEAGDIALDEVPDSPGANKLQRAVGRGGEADARWIPVRAGWTYLLVSDGVTKAMRLDELGQAMTLFPAGRVCEAVTAKVEERGPDDNFTVVAVRVLKDDDGTTTQEAPTLPRAAAAPLPPRPSAASSDGRAGASTHPTRGPFNPPETVRDSRRSPLGAIATVLAVLALAVAGFAAYTAMDARDAAASRDEVARLRGQVDSLRALLPPDTTAVPAFAADSPSAAAGTAPTTVPGAPPAAPATPIQTRP